MLDQTHYSGDVQGDFFSKNTVSIVKFWVSFNVDGQAASIMMSALSTVSVRHWLNFMDFFILSLTQIPLAWDLFHPAGPQDGNLIELDKHRAQTELRRAELKLLRAQTELRTAEIQQRRAEMELQRTQLELAVLSHHDCPAPIIMDGMGLFTLVIYVFPRS